MLPNSSGEALPSFIANVPKKRKESYTKVQQQALLFGCPEKYLYLADGVYLTEESYKIHNLKTFYYKTPAEKQIEVTAVTQYSQLTEALNSLKRNNGKLILLNSYPYVKPGICLLWHLVCQLSDWRIQSVTNAEIDFNYTGLFRPEFKPYALKQNHVVAFGPCSGDNFHEYDYKTLTSFLSRFDHYNKIVLSSAKNIQEFVTKAHYAPEDFDFIFQIDCGFKEPAQEKPKKTVRKKTKVI